MPHLSVETSMICELWVDDHDVATIEQRSGAKQCGGLTHVYRTLKFDKVTDGKTRRRVCTKCGRIREAFEAWTGTLLDKRIVDTNHDEQPRLPFCD